MPDSTRSPQDLLGVAAEHATGRVPQARGAETAGAVRAALLGRQFDCADDVAVLEGAKLVGVVPIERLLAAPEDATLAALMDADPPAVGPGTSQERVAWQMVEHGESSIAVLDADGRFLGLIPPHRMLAALLAEHEEDIARLAGYLAGAKRARGAAEEGVGRRLRHRMPWLLLGLAGAMASAGIMAAFERQLADQVLLALFVPAVVYLADAVGTQTEAVLIRGLSVQIAVRTVMRREVASGLIIGLLLGAAFLAFALVVWGDGRLAVAVALSLAMSCSIATVVAMALPWAFHRLGRDPAFGSGPLATVIQDLLSIAVYLAIATAIVD
jgi:magnesium transporter